MQSQRNQRRLILLAIMANASAATSNSFAFQKNLPQLYNHNNINIIMPGVSSPASARIMSCFQFQSRTRARPLEKYGFVPSRRLYSTFSAVKCTTFSSNPTKSRTIHHNFSAPSSISKHTNMSQTQFIQNITSFLDHESIPYRPLTRDELHHVLNYNSHASSSLSNMTNELEYIITSHRRIYLVGQNCHEYNLLNDRLSSKQALFVLHLCPTLTLSNIQESMLHPSSSSSSSSTSSGQKTISQSVAMYAWMNAYLTDAFLKYNTNSQSSDANHTNNKYIQQKQKQNQQHKHQQKLPIVHLHQDIYNHNPSIVQSRLKSKVGLHTQRIYGRQCSVRRITKCDYLPFLEENHLWGGTGAKYGFGLFRKTNASKASTITTSSSTTTTTTATTETLNTISKNSQELVAVATFSPKRKVSRAGSVYQSYELLRFCTKLDTTVVGGLTKLISAFVKEIPQQQQQQQQQLNKKEKINTSNNSEDDFGIDIITSIDRDFGSNTWPQFETMDVMEPVPMFIGEDGIRRHAVGAGLIPLEQYQANHLELGASEVLRAGLPLKLRDELHQGKFVDGVGSPWEVAADEGFHPVFDAGVERLMYIVRKPCTSCKDRSIGSSREEGDTTIGTSNADFLTSEEMWEQSVPRFVTKHYSPNQGVDLMLRCIQDNRLF